MQSAANLSKAAQSFWAKSWLMGGGDIEGWLPLWQHLHDAAGIAGMSLNSAT